jgi:putative phage-type endonuclease
MNPPVIHTEIEQGTPEWHALRCGTITASEVKHLLTATGKTAKNDKARAFILEKAAQRISRYVEPVFQNDAMLRGHDDEIEARTLYADKYAPVQQVGFVTREIAPGVIVGASPDGIVGECGLIEVKSRAQKYQVETIAAGVVPDEYAAQIQTQLLVTGRVWCDFLSYCGGLPMFVFRVAADAEAQAAIIEACAEAEARIQEIVFNYHKNAEGLHPTVRRESGDFIL